MDRLVKLKKVPKTNDEWDEFILKNYPNSFSAECIELRRAIKDLKCALKKVPPYSWIAKILKVDN